MTSVPTFLQNKEVVITKTINGGFALSESKDVPVEMCVVFETWDAAVYYLAANFAAPVV